ncbi:MAG TPA: DUF3800 domain-containing protein, partial [Pontimonas sp.]|nr:DUF3800 domain-containing protein [Pontimonas sp.]
NVIRLSGHRPRGTSIRKVRFVDSLGNPLIQLADMIAGCAKRSVQDDHKSSAEYRALLSHLLEGLHSSAERIP